METRQPWRTMTGHQDGLGAPDTASRPFPFLSFLYFPFPPSLPFQGHTGGPGAPGPALVRQNKLPGAMAQTALGPQLEALGYPWEPGLESGSSSIAPSLPFFSN